MRAQTAVIIGDLAVRICNLESSFRGCEKRAEILTSHSDGILRPVFVPVSGDNGSFVLIGDGNMGYLLVTEN